MKFRSIVILGGKTATGIEVPAKIVASLGSGKRPAVRVTLNGHTYRSTVAVMDGKYMLPLSAENRAAAGVAAGDKVEVEVALDDAPREVAVPPDLAAALKRDAAARKFFEGLSYSHKRWYVLWIEGAKKAETREKRVGEAVVRLKAGWKPGS
jgi:hypothetical protein